MSETNSFCSWYHTGLVRKKHCVSLTNGLFEVFSADLLIMRNKIIQPSPKISKLEHLSTQTINRNLMEYENKTKIILTLFQMWTLQ